MASIWTKTKYRAKSQIVETRLMLGICKVALQNSKVLRPPLAARGRLVRCAAMVTAPSLPP
jgi:hypothetical protein